MEGSGREDGTLAVGVGAPAPERGELARIARALERIADAQERIAGALPQRRREQAAEQVEVNDTDRAAARATARRLGLIVREPKA